MRWIRSLLVVTALVGLSALATSSIPVCAQNGDFDPCANVQPDVATDLSFGGDEIGGNISIGIPGAIKRVAAEVIGFEPDVSASIGLNFELNETLDIKSTCRCGATSESTCCPEQFDVTATTTKTVRIPELPEKLEVQQTTSVIRFETVNRNPIQRLNGSCEQEISKSTTTFSSSVNVGFSVGAQFGSVGISASVSNDNLIVNNIIDTCNCGNPDRSGNPCLGAQPLRILDVTGPIVLRGSPGSTPATEFDIMIRDPNRGQTATRIDNADNYEIGEFLETTPDDVLDARIIDKRIVSFNTIAATARVELACPDGGQACLEEAESARVNVDAQFRDPNPDDEFNACDVGAQSVTVPILTEIGFAPMIEGLEVNGVGEDSRGALARVAVKGTDANVENDRILLDSASSPKGSLTPLEEPEVPCAGGPLFRADLNGDGHSDLIGSTVTTIPHACVAWGGESR